MFKKIIALIFSMLLSLGFLECGTRVFLNDKVDSEVLRSKFFKIGAIPSDDPELVYELKDGLTYIDKETTSSIKLAVIGDSTPYGWGPVEKMSYPYFVGKKLNMQLRNYSVPGYNTKQELIQYRKYVKEWKPDYVIIHHDGNDADQAARFFPVDCSNPDFGNNVFHSALIKYTIRTISSINPKKIDTKINPVLGWSIVSGPMYEEHLLNLKTLIQEASGNGAKVFVVLYDSEKPSEERKNLLREPLIKRLENMPCQVISLESVWEDRISDEDLHPNPKGQKKIGEQIIKEMIN